MTFLQLAFYVFSAILVFAATMVVTIRNPVKSALFLVLAFFSASCVWITLQAEFLAIVLVLVYVGAVMVLFLFVVMMLDIDLAEAACWIYPLFTNRQCDRITAGYRNRTGNALCVWCRTIS